MNSIEITSGLVPFFIKKSTVLLENNEHKNSNATIKYIVANDNNKIICEKCILPSNTQYVAYAGNNSNIVIDDDTLLNDANKKIKYGQYIANNNSYINYNIAESSLDVFWKSYINPNNSNAYYPSLYNNGETYITYSVTDSNSNSIDWTKKNNVVFSPQINANREKKITINTADLSKLTTLSARIQALQAQIDRIPSVLNGFTLEIDLNSLKSIRWDLCNITKPLVIKNFYQGTVKLILDCDATHFIRYCTTTKLNLRNLFKY